jgi:type II secretory pathway pseudopilin PulG
MCKSLITRDKKGFILVEVLITVVILSSSLVMITRSFMVSLNALEIIQQYTEARSLIEEKLAELEIKETIAADLQVEENLNEPYEKFSYSLQTKNIPEGNNQGRLNNVSLSLGWKAGEEKRQISIVTYLKNKE